jgi:hypothetical protein
MMLDIFGRRQRPSLLFRPLPASQFPSQQGAFVTLPLSRRQFFGQAPAGAVAALVVAEPPPRAWIIMQADWEFNDEYSYADGELIQGVQPQQLRDSDPLRQRVSRQMAGVQATLDGLLVDRPRRSIIRPSRPEGA